MSSAEPRGGMGSPLTSLCWARSSAAACRLARMEDGPSRYLVVYPFVKSVEWYLSPAADRQDVMKGHMRVGHRYPQVRQLLAYSFGLDDQEFIVAYETDDLIAFQDLVRELRETESRRATVRDTPIVTAIHRPLGEILQMLSGVDQ